MLEFKSKTQTLENKIIAVNSVLLESYDFCNVRIKLILNCTLFAEKGCDESSVNAISFGHAEKKLHGAVFVFRWELSFIKETSISSQISHWKYLWGLLRRQSKKRTLLGAKSVELLRAPFHGPRCRSQIKTKKVLRMIFFIGEGVTLASWPIWTAWYFWRKWPQVWGGRGVRGVASSFLWWQSLERDGSTMHAWVLFFILFTDDTFSWNL